MKKILLSMLSIAAVGVVAFGATTAFFTDTEESRGNIFESGSIDLKIDNTSYLNGERSDETSWELRNLTNELFFDFHDLKPGDEGEDTVSLHVYDNDAWACVDLTITANDDATDASDDIDCTEPELEADDDCDSPAEPDDNPFDGELAGELQIAVWADDGDNVYEDHERLLQLGGADNPIVTIQELAGQGVLTLADSEYSVFTEEPNPGEPLVGSQTYHLAKAWCYGTLTPDPVSDNLGQDPTVDSGFDCDGTAVGNISQTDMLKGDIVFRAEQARNNEDFLCRPV